MTQIQPGSPVRTAIEIAVYLLLIFGILAWCLQIVSPFISLMMWGTVIAVAAYKPFLKLREALGGRNKLAVAIFVVLGLATVIVPAWMLAGSLIESTKEFYTSLESGQFSVPPPNESVREWPAVGERLYTGWSSAAANFEGWLEAHNDQIKSVSAGFVSRVAGIGLSLLQFIASVLIAAALLANAEAFSVAMKRVCRRLAGDKAEDMLNLSTATVRSVTVGVLGIAFIQALLGGAGMMFAGVPGAGIWALIIMVLAIAQLPPLLVLLPAIFYVFSANDSTTVAVLFTVWSVFVSFSDALLKPLFLGRGVEAPMLVILLGAIGGMIHSGIIGLFTGAVILALGYTLFMAWMDSGKEQPEIA